MAEPMRNEEEGVDAQRAPTWTIYAEAMNKFSVSAIAFMEHVHLLTEARTAYEEAMSVGTELRKKLDAGDKTMRGLMAQLEQVVSAHLGEPSLDGKKPELVKGQNTRTSDQATRNWKIFP